MSDENQLMRNMEECEIPIFGENKFNVDYNQTSEKHCHCVSCINFFCIFTALNFRTPVVISEICHHCIRKQKNGFNYYS